MFLAWMIRTYAFTVFSVPAGGLPPLLKEGNRVIVNRIDCDKFDRGEMVVFADSTKCKPSSGESHAGGVMAKMQAAARVYYIGKIEKLPGDTIKLDSNLYVIPTICCKRCGCKDCRYYLVRTAGGSQLVHKHQIIGKAYKLF